MVIEHLEPRAVFSYFEQISAIPHGSGNTKAISDFCVRFAQQRGLKYKQDSLNNVIIYQDASPGYESAQPVILQGHLDMVCEKVPACPVDFTSDGLSLATDGVKIWAEGTTLGSDDGIAVAMALAILDDSSIPHPPLEVVFTVDEEVGMGGAAGLDGTLLTARRMLNIDSEEEGVFTVSCAGGARAVCCIPATRSPVFLPRAELRVSGLIGGHSGQEIDKGRGNSNILMGRVLEDLAAQIPLRLVTLSGGRMDNAIPLETVALIAVNADELGIVNTVAAHWDAVFKKEYAASDSGISVSASLLPAEQCNAVIAEDSLRIADALTLFPNGIQAMCMDMPGLVQTSLNLGILCLEEDQLRATFSVRSSLGTQKEMIKKKLSRLCSRLGGSISFAGEYPAWEYQKHSPIRDLAVQIYREQAGVDPRILAIHAGLECGLFSEKLPGLDCISYGPDLTDIHTCREKMDIASVQRVWRFTLEMLKRMK